MTTTEMLQKGALFLKNSHIESARLDSEILLAFALGISRNQLLLSWDRSLKEREIERFEGFLDRRRSREPIAYIIGTKEFMSLSFLTTPEVLIPRPETELLVEAIIKRTSPGYTVWDIGTGSGCIAISLAVHSKPKEILATDIQEKALQVAKQNAFQLEVKDKINFARANLFQGVGSTKKFDVLVMNPPYIDYQDKEKLAPELDYEPKEALFAKKNGWAIYIELAKFSHQYIKSSGILAIELSSLISSREILSLFKQESSFKKYEILKDYNNLDRILIASS